MASSAEFEGITIKLPGKGKHREAELHDFAIAIRTLNDRTDFQISSRGWCYQLENFNLITKDQFNRVQKLINECRKKGLLPIDFVLEDKARQMEGVYYPTTDTPAELIKLYINAALNSKYYHKPDYWSNETHYIQMLVEKVDLVSLFEPVCRDYKIPISNSRGWSSILQRANMAFDLKKHLEAGRKPVLLYCGDHDPFGLAISDYLYQNFKDIQDATGFNPDNLIIDRFGLNKDLIDELNLTWIDNLISGTGKQPDTSKQIVSDYIKQFGERKVEANAIVIRPTEARQLCKEAIEKYLGPDYKKRKRETQQAVFKQYDQVMQETGIKEPLEAALDLLPDKKEG